MRENDESLIFNSKYQRSPTVHKNCRASFFCENSIDFARISQNIANKSPTFQLRTQRLSFLEQRITLLFFSGKTILLFP